MNRRTRIASIAAALAGACACSAAVAQDDSRIVAVTIYMDSAAVDRELKVPGGRRHVELRCMPPGVDIDTLQVDGAPNLQLADVRSEPALASESRACARNPLEVQRRALAEQKVALEAQSQAADLALKYLQRWNPPGEARTAPSEPARPGPSADALRKAALDQMNELARLKQQIADVDQSLATLNASASGRRAGTWSTVRFDVSTEAAATLHVRYQVGGTQWRTAYRAALDTATSTVRIDREAVITQGSGEDWTNVALKLSTGRARMRADGALPGAWALALHRPPPPPSSSDLQRVEISGGSVHYPSLAQAAPGARGGLSIDEEPMDRTPLISLGVEQANWDTEFRASAPVSFASDNQTHTLTLESLSLPVRTRLRSTPQLDPTAYLLAELPRPPGVWPFGDLQLWRDGALVGKAGWSPAEGEHMTLPFGRDDRVRVTVDKPSSMTSAQGLFGSRTERAWGAVYAFTSSHDRPLELEVLDAAPVSHDAEIKVASRYEPQPSVAAWENQPSVVAWRTTLQPAQAQRFSVSHTVTFPKDARVTNLPDAP